MQCLEYNPMVFDVFVFFVFWRTSVLFLGPLKPLFWISFDVWPRFQSQRGSPRLHASSPECNRFLRFTSGVIPADLLVASMAAQLFWSTYLRTSIGGAQVRDLACNSMFVFVYMYIKIQDKMKTENTLMTQRKTLTQTLIHSVNLSRKDPDSSGHPS